MNRLVRFTYVTAAEIEPFLTDDGGNGFAEFQNTASVQPDSFVYIDGTDDVDIRYPIEFLGAHRCVFVGFTFVGTAFRVGGGSECTDFRG